MTTETKPLCQEIAEALKLDFVKLGLKFDVARPDTFAAEAAKIAAEFMWASYALSGPLKERTYQAIRNL